MTQMLKVVLFVFISTLSLHASIQRVTASYVVVQTAGTKYVGDASNQTYSINPTSITAGSSITIIDQGGSNTIELVGGLTISSSKVVSDELVLTLSNGASIDIRGADTFTFDVGANAAASITGTQQNFSTFETSTLGLTSVPTQGQAVVNGGVISAIVDGGATGTIIISSAGTSNADSSDITFKITANGSYVYTINNFGAGDVLSFLDDNISVMNTNPSDAEVSLFWHDVTIKITGLSFTSDVNLFTLSQFNVVFGAGTISTSSLVTNISNKAPTANAGIDQSVNKDDNVLFDASGSSDDGTIVSYEWKDGNTVLSTASSFSTSNLSVGTHTITLTVTDNDGMTASDTTIVVINGILVNVAPIANAGIDQTVNEGSNVTLTSIVSAGTIASYEWKEGTIILSTQSSFTKSNFSVGTHYISLTVKNNIGASATDMVVVTVNAINTTINVKYTTVDDLKNGTFNLIYQYDYPGASYHSLDFTISKITLVGSKLAAVSSGYPIMICNDNTDNLLRTTISGSKTYKWDYICLGTENAYTSYYTFFVMTIDETGKVLGIFNKDTNFNNAYLNLYNNYDGFIAGYLTGTAKSRSSKLKLPRYYIPPIEETIKDMINYIDTSR